METKDAIRINGDVPLIVDATELITPEIARNMLKQNTLNRPINWKKVEEYAESMRSGKWKLHSQGIIFDDQGRLQTGQKRLWAIVYSGVDVLMRVSRGCPSDTVRLIDRGTAQTDRDMASRETRRKHSQIESSIVRAYLVLNGNPPTKDNIADIMIEKAKELEMIMKETKGTKKTRAILMILGAICNLGLNNSDLLSNFIKNLEHLSDKLETRLRPSNANTCWGRGVAFTLAMEQAKTIVEEREKP